MARFVLSLHAANTNVEPLLQLNRFANQVLDNGHIIDAVFLYQDAVSYALPHIYVPNDEVQPNTIFTALHKRGVNFTLCVTAAEKRGVSNDASVHPLAPYFALSGLAEFAMQAAKADKWVQFK